MKAQHNLKLIFLIAATFLFFQTANAQQQKVEMINNTGCTILCNVLTSGGSSLGAVTANSGTTSYGCIGPGTVGKVEFIEPGFPNCILFTVNVSSTGSCSGASCPCSCFTTSNSISVSGYTSGTTANLPCSSSTGPLCLTITLN